MQICRNVFEQETKQNCFALRNPGGATFYCTGCESSSSRSFAYHQILPNLILSGTYRPVSVFYRKHKSYPTASDSNFVVVLERPEGPSRHHRPFKRSYALASSRGGGHEGPPTEFTTAGVGRESVSWKAGDTDPSSYGTKPHQAKLLRNRPRTETKARRPYGKTERGK
jgi:hypothetical protein